MTRSIFLFLILFLIIFLIFPLFSFIRVFFFNSNSEFIGFFEAFNFLLSILTEKSFIVSLKHSLLISLIVSIVVSIWGVFHAYVILHFKENIQFVFSLFGVIFLFFPSITHGSFLLFFFGNNGIFTSLTGININLYGFRGIFLGEILYVFPVAFLMAKDTFSKLNKRWYEFADGIGVSKLKQFMTITIPSVRLNIISIFFMSFTMVFTDYGIPLILGQKYTMLASDMYSYIIALRRWDLGAVIGLVLLFPAIISIIVDRYVAKKNTLITIDKSPIFKVNKFYRIYMTLFIVFVLTYLSVIFYSSLVVSYPNNTSFTLNHYTGKGTNFSIIKLLINTAFISFVVGIVGSIFTFFYAYIVEKGKLHVRIQLIAHAIASLPLSLPGLVLGVSYVMAFSYFSNGFIILIIVNIIHFLSVPYLMFRDHFRQISNSYNEINDIMGVSMIERFKVVFFPISSKVLYSVFVYFFTNSMITISAIAFLYTPDTMPFSMAMVHEFERGNFEAIFAFSSIIFLLNFSLFFIKEKFITHQRRKN